MTHDITLYWSVIWWLGNSAAYIQGFILYLVISQRHAEEGLPCAKRPFIMYKTAAEMNGIVLWLAFIIGQ